ncbi:hypothetical protein XM38_012480 [Halomicronema hongdechloris C2206]|uniref:SF3 helicase domain-containing protein n=1 Tax=Halomicronema hongdechloris C2206 TaxID=1641165 RepID=A0A1Z3HJ35_9CYAN|nr:hypothetical protein XM38_012480 [Halomicronema hongdechloris C2206]
MPPGATLSDLAAVTEGWKDAAIATIRTGRPVGAIAGVSHIAKTLPAGVGVTTVFDSDGLTNANVMQALIRGGLHLGGKITLIPRDIGEKCGATEFFGSGRTQSDFDQLLAGARNPRAFFLQWLGYLSDAPLPKNCDTLTALYQRLWRIAWHLDRDCHELRSRVEAFIQAHSRANGVKLNKPDVRAIRSAATKPLWERESQRQLAERRAAATTQTDSSWTVKRCFDDAITLTPDGVRLPPTGKLAALMEQSWSKHLKWRLDFSSFYAYGRTTPGLWERVSDREVKELVQRELDAAGTDGEYGLTVVDNTVALLSQRVSVRQLPQAHGYIPFRNGVLRVSDRTLLEHSPDYGFTWQLPYDYIPGAECGPVVDWLGWAVNGDKTVVQLIRACLKAMILGRTDFQRYLEIVGPGGTGKGVLIRLIQALLGRSNTVSTSLSRIANSRFETGRFMGKRLIFIPDADYNPTAVDTLKQLTGEDFIPWERKNENSDYCDGFTLEGWVMVATNREIVASDHTNALFRRRIPIYFNHVVPDGERRDLISFCPDGSLRGEFADLLPGVFNWVLDMPDKLMERYIKNPREYVRSMGEFQAETLLETNSVAAWVDENVVYQPGEFAKIGGKNNPADSCLYPNYVAWCEATGSKTVGLRTFVKDFKNLFCNELGLDVSKRRDRNRGSGFDNIRLRICGGDGEPREDEPCTVERALGGSTQNDTNGDGDGISLSKQDLKQLLNLYSDDPPVFESELQRLSGLQRDHLYQELPELRPMAGEVNGHVR